MPALEPDLDKSPTPPGAVTALVGRITWMMAGPVLLLVSLVGVAASEPRLGAADALVLGFIALTLGGRWLEHRSGMAHTAYGAPATAEHFRTYATRLPLAGLLAWGAAKALAAFALG